MKIVYAPKQLIGDWGELEDEYGPVAAGYIVDVAMVLEERITIKYEDGEPAKKHTEYVVAFLDRQKSKIRYNPTQLCYKVFESAEKCEKYVAKLNKELIKVHAKVNRKKGKNKSQKFEELIAYEQQVARDAWQEDVKENIK